MIILTAFRTSGQSLSNGRRKTKAAKEGSANRHPSTKTAGFLGLVKSLATTKTPHECLQVAVYN